MIPSAASTIKLNHKLFDLSTPIVMGILNATPDSFFKGNRYTGDKAILNRAEEILSSGGIIIDVGGYSTRPDAENVSRDEELKRVAGAIELILRKFPDAIISVDTFRAGVIRDLATHFPIAMINDISGGTFDNLMFETVAECKLAYVLMHTRGTPQTMQQMTQYTDITAEVLSFLEKRIARLKLLGVTDIVVDPGFGFAKTTAQNYTLLRNLPIFEQLQVPLLAGLSRKSMLYKVLETSPSEALNATTAANTLALIGGASILRVHDVKEAAETIKIFNHFRES